MHTGYMSQADESGNVHQSNRTRPASGWLLYRFGLLIFGLLWVFLSSTLCGCGSMNGYVMNRSGRKYFDKGNYEYARYEFERALMDDPHNANYAYNVARAMEKEGEYTNAEQMYQHALTLNPNHLPSYHALASMLREQGRTAESRDLLVAWADTQPYSADAQMTAAQMYQQDGNPAAAQQHYQQAMRDMPSGRPRRRRMAQNYYPQPAPQMAMQNPQMGHYSPRFPYSTAPSLQMASTMPQNDFTMMGGPVVAPRTMASTPVFQQPMMQGIPSDPAMSPGMEVPTPQQYQTPMMNGAEPQLLPELPAPTSSTGPQAYGSQQFVYQQPQMPEGAFPGQYTQYPTTQQVMMSPQNIPAEGYPTQQIPAPMVQAPGNFTQPQMMNSPPVQNISTQHATNVVPAVQAF